MAIGRPLSTLNMGEFVGGCNYNSDITSLDITESPNSMNIDFDKDYIRKRFGYRELNATASGASDTGHSVVEFGVTGVGAKLIAHMGEAVYKMDNLDGTLDTLLAAAPDARSYNSSVKQNLIQTYDNYSQEMYWDGASGTMLPLSDSAPGFKHTIEFQGYLLGGNTSANKLRIYYEDINTMIEGTYGDYFTLTGSQDGYISGFFLINGRCYAGTSDGIFRISYIGGLAVFQYKQVISNVGIVPGTLQVVVTADRGQLAMFLGTDKNVYLFDGSFVKNVAQKYRMPNNDTPICLEYINSAYINKSHSVYDPIKQIYRLFIVERGQTECNYALNINVDTFAYYPYDKMAFASAAIVRDVLGRQSLVGADYSGKLHRMFINHNSDNGTVILESYESPILSKKLEAVAKASTMDLYFVPKGNYKVRYDDRTDFDKTWKTRHDIRMFATADKFLGGNTNLGTTFKLGSDVSVVRKAINIPIVENGYRFRLRTTGSSSGDACYYEAGTVAGTGATTSITGTSTTWTSDMTSANGYRIHIKDGNHANTTYTFDYASATTATVGTMAAGNFTGASYGIYKTSCASCSKGWELIKVDYNKQLLSIGTAEAVK